MTIRTFVALEIPEDPINQILKIRDENFVDPSSKVRWEPINKLHLTIKFLGDTNQNNLNDYFAGLEKIISDYAKLELSFTKFGIFKREGKPKILWAGLSENKILSNLVVKIDQYFSNFGFEKESRKFNPHITLLRIKGYEDSRSILNLADHNFEEIKFMAGTLTFFQSKLMPNGSEYIKLKSFYLK